MTEWLLNQQKASVSSDEIIKQFGFDPESIIKIEELAQIHPAFKWLDVYAGCDWIIKNQSNQIYGIAVRVQLTQPNYYHNPHNSFSIRSEMLSGRKTELEKRQQGLIDKCFGPQYQLHCFMKSENPQEFLSGAIIKTDDLYDFLSKFPHLVGGNAKDNKFQYVRWTDLISNGYPVKIIQPEK